MNNVKTAKEQICTEPEKSHPENIEDLKCLIQRPSQIDSDQNLNKTCTVHAEGTDSSKFIQYENGDGSKGGLTAKTAIIGTCVNIEIGAIIGEGVKIGENSKIGDGVSLGSHAVIGKGVKIEKNTVIGSHAVIGDNADIGEDARIGSKAHILDNVIFNKNRRLF